MIQLSSAGTAPCAETDERLELDTILRENVVGDVIVMVVEANPPPSYVLRVDPPMNACEPT